LSHLVLRSILLTLYPLILPHAWLTLSLVLLVLLH
jgi:hypothetical protein